MRRPTAPILLAIFLAACAGAPEPAATLPPASSLPTPTVTPTPVPAQPPGSLPFVAPVDTGPMLLDLQVMDAANIVQLEPLKQLVADGLPGPLAAASLAFYPSYEYQLAGHLDDGRLLVWDMATGAVVYEDRHASADSWAGQHPALTIDPSFQRYLATSAGSSAAGSAAGGVIYRNLDDPQASFLLPGGGSPPDTAQALRVYGLAYSPDGQQLASSLAGDQGGSVQLWDVWADDPGLVAQIDFDQPAAAIQFTPDGSALVCAVGNSLVYLDPATGGELFRRAFAFPIVGLTFSASGESLVVWGEHRAVLQAPGFAAPLQVSAIDRFRRIEFSPDERLAIVVDGDSLRSWDLSGGLELTMHLLSQGPPELLDVRFLDNGRVLATIDVWGQVILWGVPGKPAVPPTYARITPANAASVIRANGLYVPRALDTRLTAQADLLAIETSQGIYLAGVPNFETRKLLPIDGLTHTTFDLSSDGARLAWLFREGTVRIWDVRQDRVEHELTGLGEGCCWQLRFTPDGRYLAAVADLTARVWYVPTWQEVYTVDGVQQVHASPDSTRMAFEQGLDVSLLDLASGRQAGFLTGFTTAAPIITTRFSPDWSAMYWVGRASMQFADVQSGRLGPTADFSWGEFSSDGRRIVVVEDGWIYATVGQAYVLDVRTGETLAILDHHADAIIQAVAYSPDGRLIATALDTTIKLWDATTGAELATLPPAGGAVQDLEFSADQRMLFSMSGSDVVELWMLPEGAEAETDLIDADTVGLLAPLDSLRLEEAATDAVFSPDRQTVAVSTASGAIWTWDLDGGGTREAPSDPSDWVYQLAYAPDGSGLASVSMGGYARFQAANNAYAVGTESGEMSALAFLPLGSRLATSGEDRMLRLWSMPSFQLLKAVQAHAGWIWGLAASPSGDLLATASADRTVKVWQISGLPTADPGITLARTLTGHTETVWGVAFAPDGHTLASASWDRTVRLWDATGGGPLRVLNGHRDWVYGVAFSPAGDLLASSSADGTIRLWDPATGASLDVLEGSGRIWSVEFSPDGRYLVSASDSGDVVLWGVAR